MTRKSKTIQFRDAHGEVGQAVDGLRRLLFANRRGPEYPSRADAIRYAVDRETQRQLRIRDDADPG